MVKLFISIILFVLICNGCSRKEANYGQEVNGLRLKLHMEKIEEGNLKVIYEIENVSNTTKLLYLPEDKNQYYSFIPFYIISKSKDSELCFNSFDVFDHIPNDVLTETVSQKDFIKIESKTSYMTDEDNYRWATTATEGEIDLVGGYKIPECIRKYAPNVWTGEVKSNIITVKIKKEIPPEYLEYLYILKMLGLTLLLSLSCIFIYRKILQLRRHNCSS